MKFKFSKFSWYSNWEDVGHFTSNYNTYLIQVRINRKGKKQYRNEKVNKGTTTLAAEEIRNGMLGTAITHWMPLPKLPEEMDND